MSDHDASVPIAIPPPTAAGTMPINPQPAERRSIPPNIQQMVASKRLQQAQAQVGEVVDIMRVNVEKVLERDQKLSELDRRADDLQEGASQFQQQAVKLKRRCWWENAKMWIAIGLVLIIVILIIVLTTTGGNGVGQGTAGTSAPEMAVDSGDGDGKVAGVPSVGSTVLAKAATAAAPPAAAPTTAAAPKR
jgi:vesicle-associated membrane protein 2